MTPVLARLDVSALRQKAEAGLFEKYNGTTPVDYQLQYVYHKVDPNKPVNGVSVVAVFHRMKPMETRKEDLGSMSRLLIKREQLWVEMDPWGAVQRISAKVVEQEEVASKP